LKPRLTICFPARSHGTGYLERGHEPKTVQLQLIDRCHPFPLAKAYPLLHNEGVSRGFQLLKLTTQLRLLLQNGGKLLLDQEQMNPLPHELIHALSRSLERQ
jgi:hypothetical protein